MAYEMKDMSGSLFKNDKKETESQPNAKGSALIGGVHYWVSAWTKKDKNGNPWQSLAFTPKDADEKPAQRKTGTIDDMDSDIPF